MESDRPARNMIAGAIDPRVREAMVKMNEALKADVQKLNTASEDSKKNEEASR